MGGADPDIFLRRQSIRIGDSMSLRRLVIPLITALAIVAIGAATTTALVAARGEQPETLPPESIPPAQAGTPDTPTPAPTVVINFEVPPKTGLDSSSLPEPKPVTENTEPKPTPKAALDRGPKGNRIPPAPVQESSTQPISKAADSTGNVAPHHHAGRGEADGGSPSTGKETLSAGMFTFGRMATAP